jgi:hypothetical protein
MRRISDCDISIYKVKFSQFANVSDTQLRLTVSILGLDQNPVALFIGAFINVGLSYCSHIPSSGILSISFVETYVFLWKVIASAVDIVAKYARILDVT